MILWTKAFFIVKRNQATVTSAEAGLQTPDKEPKLENTSLGDGSYVRDHDDHESFEFICW